MHIFPEAKLCPEHPDGKKLCTCVSLVLIPGLSVFQAAGEHVVGPYSCMSWRQKEILTELWTAQTQPGAFIPWVQQGPKQWTPGYNPFCAERDVGRAQRKLCSALVFLPVKEPSREGYLHLQRSICRYLEVAEVIPSLVSVLSTGGRSPALKLDTIPKSFFTPSPSGWKHGCEVARAGAGLWSTLSWTW